MNEGENANGRGVADFGSTKEKKMSRRFSNAERVENSVFDEKTRDMYRNMLVSAYRLLEKKILEQRRYLEDMGVSTEDDSKRLYETRQVLKELKTRSHPVSVDIYFEDYERMISEQSKCFKQKLIEYALNVKNG